MLNDQQTSVFETLYRTKNVTQAAEELYLSRQAVSAGLARIEKHLGVRLFERGTVGVEPTDAANALHGFLQTQAKLWAEFTDKVCEKPQSETLNIACPLLHYSPKYIQRFFDFRRQEPDVQINLQDIEDFQEAEKQLLGGKLDIAGTRKIPADPSIEVIEVYAYPPRILFGKSNPLAKTEEEAIIDCQHDLRGQTVLFVSQDTMDEVAESLPDGTQSQLIAPNRELLTEALVSSDAVFVYPEPLGELFDEPRLASRPVANYPCCTVASLVAAPNPSPLVERFRTYWKRANPRSCESKNLVIRAENAMIASDFRLTESTCCPFAEPFRAKACTGCRWA